MVYECMYVCMYAWLSSVSFWGIQSLWFKTIIVILCGFSLATNWAQYMDYVMVC